MDWPPVTRKQRWWVAIGAYVAYLLVGGLIIGIIGSNAGFILAGVTYFAILVGLWVMCGFLTKWADAGS